MKRLLFLFLATLIVASAGFAQPLPPVNGLYDSVTQGGVVLDGRFSESWMAPGGEGMVGNTINAQSWDGSTLGTEWRVWCASIAAAPVLQSDTRDANGTGQVTYETIYGNGWFWFSRFGPWSADNAVDFTGTIQSFVVTSTHEYVDGTRIGVRANITINGLFDQLDPTWDPACMDYLISNTSIFGDTTMGSLPTGYPMFLDPNVCPNMAALSDGAWGSVTQITLYITGCVVPAEETTSSGENRFIVVLAIPSVSCWILFAGISGSGLT